MTATSLLRLTAVASLTVAALACGHARPAPTLRAPQPQASAPRESPEPVHRVHSRDDDLPPRLVVRPPARLAIPTIGVDAPVEHVDFLDVPRDPRDVAWFRTGPAPGEPGTATFDGHLDWTTGPAVFWRLANVRAGDDILISGNAGPVQRWKVDLVQSVPYTSSPPDWLYAAHGPPRISLITCGGAWLGRAYADRLLVRAVPAENWGG